MTEGGVVGHWRRAVLLQLGHHPRPGPVAHHGDHTRVVPRVPVIELRDQEVIDLGVMVPADKILKAAVDEDCA